MPRDEEDAILSLGGFALEGLLTDLDADAVSGLRAQLGLSSANIGYGREDLYNGKFADDDSGIPSSYRESASQDGRGGLLSGSSLKKDWEDEVDREFREELERRPSTIGKVRGEMDDYDDDEDIDEDGSLAADSPQAFRSKKHSQQLDLSHRYSSSTSTPSSAFQIPSSPTVIGIEKNVPEPASVYDLFPTFVKGGILQFTDLFATLPRKRQKVTGGYVDVNFPETLPSAVSTSQTLEDPYSNLNPRKPDQSKLPRMLEESYRELLATLPPVEEEPDLEANLVSRPHVEETSLEQLLAQQATKYTTPWKIPHDDRGWQALSMQDWENDIIWKPQPMSDSLSQPIDTLTRLSRPRNPEVEEGNWLDCIIYDAKNRPWKDFTTLHIVEEDARSLSNNNAQGVEIEKEAAKSKVPIAPTTSITWNRDSKQQALDPFNLSNDRFYEVSQEHRRRVRQTFGNLEVQHSYPAMKLQLPLYKTRLTKHEARSFHRPALQFPVNVPIKFSKVKVAKKKKDKAGRKIRNTAPAAELLKNTTDLTLKDTGPFMLFEYSEEAPPVISNIGMGSILVNYYRKQSELDEHVPNDDIGEPFVLDVADESPFMKFGSIQPGETVPTLYNNLVRAPLFKHKPSTNDFLVIRNTTETETNYYIRPIDNLYVIGQTYPVVEVPGPHSRKTTTQLKHRLQTIAFSLCSKSEDGRIRIGKVMKYFNDQNEMQMRQRLKEFMEYTRKGHNQGFWTIRPGLKVPDKEEIFKLVTPEGVCLAESMQVGQRQLLDAGYGKDADIEGDGDDQSKLDIEQQLAPWSTTKNFLAATSNKAMLRLYGEGDPSGRGEAFSFIRVSMKEMFLRDGETLEERQAELASRPKSSHRLHVGEQQDVYKQEIERIWQAQRLALSDPNPPQLTHEDEIRARGGRGGFGNTPATAADTPLPHQSHPAGTPVDWNSSRRSRSPSTFSRQSSPERDDGMSVASRNHVVGANKALKIRRLIDGKWQTEVVRDPTVVNAYLRQRRLIDEQESSAEALMPSDDPEKNRLAKRRIEEALAKLKRNQERRLARKNAKENGAIFPKPGSMTKIDVALSTPVSGTHPVRKCGNCGQIGHMKTNRKCPRWAEFNSAAAGVFGAVPLSGTIGHHTAQGGSGVANTSEHGGSVAGTPNPVSYHTMEE
ncbi:hypothetical protein MJO28_004325 [Puccinia striiformis f. sp. tritici]|uniref:Transcription initiation factor TFIID subunit 1 histone acetyltransferase domain-containing protein n=3 Tax=Puccinia striiformis TaxID=27350 RepID=A0A0L0VEK2_9BASI|nr:hypothetical protein Pst134EA_007088 [Puccinia striiformis f. sp. tritici]KAI9616306.1 hypothetical protein KEM48_005220 [Puccinia striiformis f. sp. tritici PST-130]KNE97705.1 hypothetical protein PSTG_08927 [Puccinia striiformis f. sp. tritici PST-78]POV98596.1 hypothetical protein PSTT_14294 [Puccinia striiformis]KAH9460019.1 hypothetical protein Pst134EB_008226 [Puccinia striiformis f. sp. tritici]KAH9469811.1 hypothetical protein Pst134EA_007088 [Puccinia striiformis f. sp. tritici]